MPRILIAGLPKAVPDSEFLRQLLVRDLPAIVEKAEGFDISRTHVVAHIVPEIIERPTSMVTFTIEGLIAQPERTAAMRQALCAAVADTIGGYLGRANLRYESIVGWCVQINRDDDGFVRRVLVARPGLPSEDGEQQSGEQSREWQEQK
jgi:hypothetical protein